MIKLRQLICELISEKMSFDQLWKSSDPQRFKRSKIVKVKPLVVNAVSDKEAWKFSYKGDGGRYNGFIYFFKEVTKQDNALSLNCSVDCSCPDYKYRYAHNNHAVGAGEVGGGSLNGAMNYKPVKDIGIGLCKHLMKLREYLATQIEPNPEKTEPENTPTDTVAAPDPDKDIPSEVPPDDSQKTDSTPEEPTELPQPPVVDKQKPVEPKQQQDPNQQKPTNVDPKRPARTQRIQRQSRIREVTSNKSRIISVLDNICRNQKVFIIQ